MKVEFCEAKQIEGNKEHKNKKDNIHKLYDIIDSATLPASVSNFLLNLIIYFYITYFEIIYYMIIEVYFCVTHRSFRFGFLFLNKLNR